MLNKAVCVRVILDCVVAFDGRQFKARLMYLLQGFSVVLCTFVILEMMVNVGYLCNWKKLKSLRMANMLNRSVGGLSFRGKDEQFAEHLFDKTDY